MKNEKLPKLISGKMNVPYIKCKAGYAEGANKPKRVTKVIEKEVIVKIRKNEKLVA